MTYSVTLPNRHHVTNCFIRSLIIICLIYVILFHNFFNLLWCRMSYLRYLHIYCVLFFAFLRLVYPMFPVFRMSTLDWHCCILQRLLNITQWHYYCTRWLCYIRIIAFVEYDTTIYINYTYTLTFYSTSWRVCSITREHYKTCTMKDNLWKLKPKMLELYFWAVKCFVLQNYWILFIVFIYVETSPRPQHHPAPSAMWT